MSAHEIIISVVSVLGLLAWIFKLVASHEIKPLEKTVSALDAKVDAKIDGIEKRLDNTHNLVLKIWEQIMHKNVDIANSPTALTDYGIKIAEKVNADALVEKYAGDVAVTKDMNEYTIQQICFDYAQSTLLDILSVEERAVVENISFNEDIAVASIMRAVGIKLRDYKFKELGKAISEINQSAPSENPA